MCDCMTLELNTRELNLNHLEARLPTVRCLLQWLQAHGGTWPMLERIVMPAVKMGLRTVDQLHRLAPRLVRLDLTMVLRHCDEMLPFSSDTLQEICFPCGSKMTDAGLCATLSGCPRLRVLELPECNYISNVSMEHAVVACRELGRISVAKCTWADSCTLQYLGADRPRRLAHAASEDSDHTAGSSSSSSAPLHLWASSIGTKKKRMRTAGAAAADGAGAQPPPPPCRITWIDVTQCRALCDASFQQLFRSIRALCLNGCTVLTDLTVDNVVRHCPQMHFLDISWSQVTDAGLEKLLRGCRALQFLACAHCGRLTDDGIRRVRPDSCQWAELNQVSFRSCQGLGPAACQEIGTRWPLLRKVDLGGLPGLDAALFRAHGWEETRCQQFYRTNAPPPATETGSGSSSASARPKRSFEELAAEDDTDLWD